MGLMFTKNKAREDLSMIHMPTAEFVQQTKDYTDNLYNNVQPTNNLNNIITDIQKQAFHQINANLNKADFNDAAAKFNIFLTLDDQIKNQFKAKVEARK
jgi:peptidase E